MEGNIKPNVENLYKPNKEKIDKFIDQFLLEEKRINEVLFGFFGLDADVLSEEEKENFISYAGYALKRVVNNALHEEGFDVRESGNYLDNNRLKRKYKDIFMHDLAHTVVTQYLTNTKEFNSSFFKGENNNVILIKEELMSLLFFNPLSNRPIPLMLLKEKTKTILKNILAKNYFHADMLLNKESLFLRMKEFDPAKDSLETFKDIYKDIVYILVANIDVEYIPAIKELKKVSKENNDDVFIKFTDDLLEKIFNEYKENELLYSEKETYSTRLLYNTFIQICGPSIKKARIIKSRVKKEENND
ncbi:MAG: hypothetical protein K9L98_01840 [Candidatus Pacebacteria bacterium]|nr:hypothetical protein [Candidatus Paceibacterota bacterium]MCF7862729.1 hypothetical protein [Candidatus Paceibacterota bacterium]